MSLFCKFNRRNGELYFSPMKNDALQIAESKEYIVLLNGELYERSQADDGSSMTDAQYLLQRFANEGARMLDFLNGIFALVIYDVEEKNLFVARDRFGVKSVYYAEIGEDLIISPDILSILNYLPQKPKANDAAIFDYLVYNRTDQSEETFFADIKKIRHGYFLTANSVGIYLKQWYNLTFKVNGKRYTLDKDEFLSRFEDSITKRIPTDKKWGVCLSGGLDSSAITSTVVNRLRYSDVHSFSSVYGKDCKSDESKYIDQFAGIVPNMHYAHPTGDLLFADLENFVRSHAEPMPTTSSYAHYCVMKLAHEQGVQVTLDGQGADEALAGYEYIPGLYYKTLFTHFRWFLFIKENIKYLKVHHSTRSLKYFAFFMLPAKLRAKARVSQRKYINPDFANRFNHSLIGDKLYGSKSMQEMLINHFEYKLEHLLKWGDCNAAAFGITSRAPFLDHELVEYCIALQDQAKVHNGYTKFILREAMRGIMPEGVRKRVDKMGFSVPQDEWFREEKFQKLIMDILTSDSFRNRGYIIPEEAVALYQRHLHGEVNVSKDIWKWINLELWFRMFIDK